MRLVKSPNLEEWITLQDIAKEAGVGKLTFARAINGDANANPKTHDLVKKMMGRIGYIPNIAALSMRTNRTFSAGVVYPRYSEPNFCKSHQWALFPDACIE